jgi:hypothetical protein
MIGMLKGETNRRFLGSFLSTSSHETFIPESAVGVHVDVLPSPLGLEKECVRHGRTYRWIIRQIEIDQKSIELLTLEKLLLNGQH